MRNLMPVVLVPGLLCDHALWGNQVKALSEKANFCIADTTQHDRIEAAARDILMKAPPQFALAGLSMGGYVAMEMVRQAPDRILKLALLNTSARPDTPEQRERRRLLIAMSQSGQFKGVTPRLLPMLIHPRRVTDVALTDTITAMAERVGRDAFIRQQTAILNRVDSRASLADIRVPVQVIGGEDDGITPPAIVKEIAEHIPRARLAIVADCGHLSPLEQPEHVTSLIEQWLHA